jgi:hypothetical protein
MCPGWTKGEVVGAKGFEPSTSLVPNQSREKYISRFDGVANTTEIHFGLEGLN